MIIKITDKDAFKDNPELALIPEMKVLNSQEVKFIALMYDYDSMYRKFPQTDRAIRIATILGMINKGSLSAVAKSIIDRSEKKYEKGVMAYKDMQYDGDRESLVAYDKAESQFREFLAKEDKTNEELKMAKDIQKALKESVEVKKELMEVMGMRRDDLGDSEEEEELSTIEKFRRNKDKENESQY